MHGNSIRHKVRSHGASEGEARDLNATIVALMDRRLVGTPSQIASRINEYINGGVGHFTLYFDRDLRNLDLFLRNYPPSWLVAIDLSIWLKYKGRISREHRV